MPKLATGQMYIGSSSGFPVAAALLPGNGCKVTIGANSTNVTNLGDSLNPNFLLNPGTVILQPNNKYVCNSILAVNFVTPIDLTARVGDLITITDFFNSAGWNISLNNVSQIIGFVNKNTSPGGHISGAGQTNAAVTLMLVRSNPDFWVAYSTTGNITIV